MRSPESGGSGGDGPEPGPPELGRDMGRLMTLGLLAYPLLVAGFVYRLDLSILDGIFLAALVELLPLLAVLQIPALAAGVVVERMEAYWSSGLTVAFLGAAAVFLGWDEPGLVAMGLVRPAVGSLVAWTAALLAFAAVLVGGFLLLERRFGLKDAPFLKKLLPRTPEEKRAFALLSLAAGFGEELAYRGFAIPVLAPLLGGPWAALVFTSAAFGLLHGYQGVPGMVRSALLGGGLGAAFLLSGSLWAAILAHVLVDLVGGLVLGDRLTR